MDAVAVIDIATVAVVDMVAATIMEDKVVVAAKDIVMAAIVIVTHVQAADATDFTDLVVGNLKHR